MHERAPLESGFVFRAAVILGGVALVFGVAGIFHFRGLDRERRGGQSDDEALIRVCGPRTPGALRLRVHWGEPDGQTHDEIGRPGREDGTWLFDEAPEGVPVTVWIDGAAPDKTPVRRPAILTRGATFEILLPADPTGS